jgi:hypothetical protein
MRIFFAFAFALAVAGVTGCAARTAAVPATASARNSYVLDRIDMNGVRLGELSASREWQREDAQAHVLTREDNQRLRERLAGDLDRNLTLQASAPLHLRLALTLQDTADNEGFAAETTDLTLNATILDDQGATIRSIVLREPASAPLQRSASQRCRLDAALDRLSHRLAAQL